MNKNILSVANWKDHQHYKDRNPPWIKLSRDLLNDYKFSCLQDASKLHLMLIWLLASQMDNKIPADSDFIKCRINVSGDINFKELIDNGFLVDASGALAECVQVAMPEGETETEGETEEAKASCPSSKEKDEAFDLFWEHYPRKIGKGVAKRTWKKLTPAEMQKTIDVVQSDEFQSFMKKQKRGKDDFRKHPSTWLTGGCWDDQFVENNSMPNGDPF